MNLYEKKYQEALERAKDILSYKEVCKEDIEYLFPELKESEDEKIRKSLIHYLQGLGEFDYPDKKTYYDWLAWLEKQGKNSTHKTKLRFRIDDFIISDYCIGKVVALTNDAYLLDTGIGIPFSYENDFHIWTIQDAKKGDVLASKNTSNILIFKKLETSTTFSSYYNIERRQESAWSNECFVPASKEQRNKLIRAMEQAGYTFDFEKKELNKIIHY